MARNPKAAEKQQDRTGTVQGEKLEPIDVVVRKLTRPDGTEVEVEVPVYPPFRLAEGGAPRRPAARKRNVPSVKRKRGAREGG